VTGGIASLASRPTRSHPTFLAQQANLGELLRLLRDSRNRYLTSRCGRVNDPYWDSMLLKRIPDNEHAGSDAFCARFSGLVLVSDEGKMA